MTGTRVCAVSAYTHPHGPPPQRPKRTLLTEPRRRHRVRELVCAYRPLRDCEGRIISVASLAIDNPRVAAQIIAPLLADQPVEMFAVACLSARNRILAWHVVSRGTRTSTPVSVPDVFVPACITPGTVSLLVAHNHPSGDPTPSHDDLLLTTRMIQAGDVMGIDVIDHLILADQRYFSLLEAGRLRRSG